MTIAANDYDTPVVVEGAFSETGTLSYFADCWFLWTPTATATETLNFNQPGFLQIFANYADASTGNNALYDASISAGNFPWAVAQGVPLYFVFSNTGSSGVDAVTITGTGPAPSFWRDLVGSIEIP